MKILFGVVELEMNDGTLRYAIQYENGMYHDQRWIDDPESHYGQVRVYRTWKTREGAEAYSAYLESKIEKVEDLGFLEKFA